MRRRALPPRNAVAPPDAPQGNARLAARGWNAPGFERWAKAGGLCPVLAWIRIAPSPPDRDRPLSDGSGGLVRSRGQNAFSPLRPGARPACMLAPLVGPPPSPLPDGLKLRAFGARASPNAGRGNEAASLPQRCERGRVRRVWRQGNRHALRSVDRPREPAERRGEASAAPWPDAGHRCAGLAGASPSRNVALPLPARVSARRRRRRR